MRVVRIGCAPWKGGPFQWVKGPPGDLAPAGSNRSSHGGEEMLKPSGSGSRVGDRAGGPPERRLATKVGFAVDSLLEGAGFEPSVPL